jgi:hypothetical protein
MSVMEALNVEAHTLHLYQTIKVKNSLSVKAAVKHDQCDSKSGSVFIWEVCRIVGGVKYGDEHDVSSLQIIDEAVSFFSFLGCNTLLI